MSMGPVGVDFGIDWVSVFMIGVVALIIINLHLGISYGTMLMPLRQWIPGLMGLDTVIGLSIIVILLRENWYRFGWFFTFVFVFGLIFLMAG
ncbi:MAG: hypothetical protein AABX01_00350 [Candidatus Micrarchaeota archaeon]